MTRTSYKLATPLISVLLGNLPALILLALSFSKFGGKYIDRLECKVDNFASMAASAEFSMLGFLAAVMALFSLIGQSESFRRYRVNGHLRKLLIIMAIAIAEIALSFCLTLSLFFPPTGHTLLRFAFASLCGSTGMIALSLFPCIGLQITAADES